MLASAAPKLNSLNSRQITDILCGCHWNPRKHLLVPNVSWGLLNWEADLLVMFDSLWCEEVEVKITRADFRRDFDEKRRKHAVLMERQAAIGCEQLVRRYWIAFPRDLAVSLLDEVPSYAGVIAVSERQPTLGQRLSKRPVGTIGDCTVLRPAPALKFARKLTEAEVMDLLRLAHLRFWDMRRRQVHLTRKAKVAE